MRKHKSTHRTIGVDGIGAVSGDRRWWDGLLYYVINVHLFVEVMLNIV